MFVSFVFLHLSSRIYICIRNFIQLALKITLHILNMKCMIRKKILGLSLSLYQRYCFDFKKRGRAFGKACLMIFMNFKNKLKMKISYTKSFANKILKSATKVNFLKYLRLSRFMYGNIHFVENRRNSMFTLTKVTFCLKKSKWNK